MTDKLKSGKIGGALAQALNNDTATKLKSMLATSGNPAVDLLCLATQSVDN